MAWRLRILSRFTRLFPLRPRRIIGCRASANSRGTRRGARATTGTSTGARFDVYELGLLEWLR